MTGIVEELLRSINSKLDRLLPAAAPASERRPRRGDKIVGTWPGAKENPARYLAIYIGPSNITQGDEIWLAWTPDDGHLCSVSVGKSWKIMPGHELCAADLS